jgi:hypothetical protein
MTTVWTNEGIRTTKNRRQSVALRDITCFEVLDYDSLTNVKVSGVAVHVVGLIYKKVRIQHSQGRVYSLEVSNSIANNKETIVPPVPDWWLDAAPASDKYTYSGIRTIEYILSLLVGSSKYILNLGTLVITANGSYNMEGTDRDLKEESSVAEVGPLFTVLGNRIYGVSVNVGKQALTYSYDVEVPKGSMSSNVLFQYDSPINTEDYNDYWEKLHRVVGAVNYKGKLSSRQFPCSSFPDTVMGVGYGYL